MTFFKERRQELALSMLTDIKIWGHFLLGLRGFLRHTISLEEARTIVRQRIAEREANFLRLVERGIFGYSRSPYLPLLKLAGCEMGDIRKMVQTRGLDETLRALREAGVYVTFDEFKGHEPIVRKGKVVSVQAGGFDNPYLHHYYRAESGGTTGTATRISFGLDHLAAESPYFILARDAHGILDVPTAIWLDILPDVSGVHNILCPARMGRVPQKWFSLDTSRYLKRSISVKGRLATLSMIVMGRLSGVPMPWPEPLSLDQAIVVARWADRALKDHGKCLVHTHVSKALRVCIAAREAGIDLTGATFMVGGEPPTPAKVREISCTGARSLPVYPFSEHGYVGIGCVQPADENDVHFFKDGLALVQFPREVPGSRIKVHAFYFTSLLPTAPKLLLNVESDDYGLIEKRSCGCPLETYGFTEHLRNMRSFRKLTGEGTTLVGSYMERILEEVLPARFGGSPLDYQLLEEEDENGFTRLSLLVHPKIQIADEAAIVEVVLDALRQDSFPDGQGRFGAEGPRIIWNQARTLRVKRTEPILTTRGKLMPLRVAQRSD